MISNEVLQLTKQRLREHLAAKETSADPIKWVECFLSSDYVPYEKIRKAMRAVKHNRQSLVFGINAASKTFSMISIMAIYWYQTHGINSRVLVISPSYSQSKHVMETINELVGVANERYEKGLIPSKIDGHVVNRVNFSVNGTDVIFARNPLPNKAAGVVKGAHSTGGTLILLEEADSLGDSTIRAAQNVLTGREDRLIAVSNSRDPFAYVMRKAKEWLDTGTCKDWHVTHISWYDMPAYTGETCPPLQATHLLQKAYVDEIISEYGEKSAEFDMLVRGVPSYDSGLTLIRASDITTGIHATYPMNDNEPEPQPVLGVDLALMGNDNSVIYAAYHKQIIITEEDEDGNEKQYTRIMTRVRYVDSITRNDINQRDQATWIVKHAMALGACEIRFDSMGIGQTMPLFLEEALHEYGLYDVPMVKMIASAKNMLTDITVNNRAAFAVSFRERLHSGLIDIDENDENLLRELQKVEYKLDSISRIQLVAKRDLSGKSSPDFQDACFYACVLPTDVEEMKGVKDKPQVIIEESAATSWDMWLDDPFLDSFPPELDF